MAHAGSGRSAWCEGYPLFFVERDHQFIPTPEHYRGYVSCTGPRACYDESKRLGETLCISFWAQRKVPSKIVRPFNVYGPGQRLNDGRMVPDMMSAALAGGPIVL